MPLGALGAEKSSASGPCSEFEADQSGDERGVRLLELRSGRRYIWSSKANDQCTDPRQRPQYTDSRPCIAIRLAFTLCCCLSPIVPLKQETHDAETEARPPCPFQ
ncbi:hypothetical protein FIBSPDRAFT_872694 [Athelia psychrophila]|uniref:Uncharacterized protein n=1 Tax=Athelia psychrophila TaxID=1759441 RepID=A0A165Z9D0_9AGAM|nr:hypothetical protein FIBSPDRAFT_872694 [Fibularhizoctonia sp. CBS 109695]